MNRHQLKRIQDLYATMPGAPRPPTVDGYYMWGDIEGNDHWIFCQSIVTMIDEAINQMSKP